MNVSLTRFESKFQKFGENDCWTWEGPLDQDGYGRFQVATGWAERAHRYAFQMYTKRLHEGQFVLHSCGNRACVNPEHLYLGSKKHNSSKQKLKCPQGHPYQGDNLYVDPSGRRRCRTCGRAQVRRFAQQEKAK